MNKGFITLHRKILEWEWYGDANTFRLFIYLLLKANHTPGKYKGIIIERGQLLTGLKVLQNGTNISIQSLRTCLARLVKTSEINMRTNNQFRIITICNYDSYQSNQQATNKQTNKQLTSNQQATNKQLTTNNNVNNVNNVKKIKPSQFDIFWKLYPRKTGKQKAKESWIKICKLKNEDLPKLSKIRKAIRNQIKSDQWQDSKYIPHPTTWLNQHRWLDEIDEFESSKSKPTNTLGTRSQTNKEIDYSNVKSKPFKN